MRQEPPVPADVLAAIREPLESSGAARADAPLLQPLNLLLDLAGEAMRARLFVVQAEGGAESCLRPDFTVAIARQHIDGGRVAGAYWYEGSAFRAASGDDRPEEFVQIGLEMFSPGGGGVEAADAEITGLAWQAAAAGGRGDLSLWLGDVALFSAFIDSLDLPETLAARLKRVAGRPRLLWTELSRVDEPAGKGGTLAGLLSGLSETQAGDLLEEVWALAGIEPVGGRGPADIAARLLRRAEAAKAPALAGAQADAIRAFMAIDDVPAYAFARMRELAGPRDRALKDALAGWEQRLVEITRAAPADRVRFTPALGHAFEYYDGLTFEVRSEAVGAERPVVVGGRYDGLLARLGGQGDSRAVGCMVRPWRAWRDGEGSALGAGEVA
ncbi:MAG: ATP phosphoribosyltransferase regulatory subunit [Phenylobacterium sp.]|nr:ATP phosphoribosyltransferase regulatory subunit [Phenylobacterium sp.]